MVVLLVLLIHAIGKREAMTMPLGGLERQKETVLLTISSLLVHKGDEKEALLLQLPLS